MSVTLQSCGPVTPIVGTAGFNLIDVVLCSDELGFIFALNNDERLHVFAVNPATGSLINWQWYRVQAGVSPDYGQFRRLDDTTVCFGFWNYASRGGNGDFCFGTITASSFTIYYHAPASSPAQIKDTGQSLYVDSASRTGSAMYFPTYGSTSSGFSTTAQAISVNFDTGSAHEFAVTINMGPDSDGSGWPQYYGTVPLPDGRVLGGEYVKDSGGNIIRIDVVDQTGRVIDSLPRGDFAAAQLNGGFLYQVNGTTDLAYVFFAEGVGVDYLTQHWLQRYATEPDFLPVGGRVMLAPDGNPRDYPAEDIHEMFNNNWQDEQDPFGGGIRVGNLPYNVNANHAGTQAIEIGVQSSHDGSTVVSQINVPNPPSNSAWSIEDTPASTFGSGRAVRVLYVFRWLYTPDGAGDNIWFQLWATGSGAPALRLTQRDDGLGIHRHPRLSAASGAASSQQAASAPRVNRTNTYS